MSDREAEIRDDVIDQAHLSEILGRYPDVDDKLTILYGNFNRLHADRSFLLAALDAERDAHAQTRTALVENTVAMTRALHDIPPDSPARGVLADRIVENQRILGLAVAEADKPHDGNER